MSDDPRVQAAINAYLSVCDVGVDVDHEAMRAAIAVANAAAWQAIDTAPKDGTPILVCISGAQYWPDKAEYRTGFGWVYPCQKHGPSLPPTHWQPLPTPPKG